MPNYIPKAGYCYSWSGDEPDCPRTQNWEQDVLLESELAGLEYRGTRMIDGARCAIWFTGMVRGYHRYVAQTCVYTQVPAARVQSDPIRF